MIIDATKIKYFNYPDRSAYDYKGKSSRGSKKERDQVGVIVDATASRKKHKSSF